MSLPSVACFRQMDIIDQLTALYEAILQISEGGSFSPDQLLGLQGWYKDSGITLEGNNVVSWNDESGNDNHLTPQLNEAPVIEQANLNGIDTVGFVTQDADNGSPLSRGSALFTGTSATLFILARKDSARPSSGWYTLLDAPQPNQHPFSDGDVFDANFSTTRKSCGTEVLPITDNWRILSIRSRDGEYSLKIDGQNQFSTGTNTFESGNDFILGLGGFDGADQTFAFQGSMAEVIVYNTFLSDSQELAVLNYFRNRFNL